jgi:hypothetical protein
VLTLLNLYEENSMNIRFRLALSVLCVTFLGLLVPSALRADNLVSNGNFASGGIDWTFTPAASGSDFFYETFPGDTYAAFGGLSTGYYDTIAQTLSTQSGQSYTLSFLIANDYGTQDADFQTLWDGVEVGDVSGINWFQRQRRRNPRVFTCWVRDWLRWAAWCGASLGLRFVRDKEAAAGQFRNRKFDPAKWRSLKARPLCV